MWWNNPWVICIGVWLGVSIIAAIILAKFPIKRKP